MKLLYFSLLFFLLVLCNCGPRRVIEKKHDSWVQQEAKLHDVPILIDAQPENREVQNSATSDVSYISSANISDAVVFYQNEMERFGWDLLASFHADESLLVFDKPTRICSISIRPYKQKVRIVIYLKSKEE